MRINVLKRALVEVKKMCASTYCSKCPIAKKDEEDIPYCPLCETEEVIRSPNDWEIDGWKEDSDETR